MEVERTEMLWQSTMNVASALKKDGVDIGDVISRLRDAKVLLNHAKFDEHAHPEELMEAEMEIEEIQRELMQIIDKVGKGKSYSFKSEPMKKKDYKKIFQKPPSHVPKGDSWVRIRLPESLKGKDLSEMEGVSILEMDDKTITLTGDKAAIKKALNVISQEFSK